MPVLHVRKQGNVCTAFQGPSGEYLPMASFDDAPGSPSTFHARELDGFRAAGWSVVCHEEKFPEQPEAPPESAASHAHLLAEAKRIGLEVPDEDDSTPPTPRAPRPAASARTSQASTAAPGRSAEERLAEAFRAARRSGEWEAVELEVVGAFLVTALPEIEAALPEPVAAPARRAFKLG